MSPDTVLRRRRDILWQAQDGGWLAFDRLKRSGYRCGQRQRWLFDQFDGQRSIGQIFQAVRNDTKHSDLSLEELLRLANTLHQKGLLVRRPPVSSSPSSSVVLAIPGPSAARPPSQSISRFLRWIAQSVTWRVRGIDPDHFLRWLSPHTDWLFAARAVQCWLALAVVMGALVLTDFTRLVEQATLWDWLIRPSQGSMLLVIFLVSRALHELGHALVLTRHGGRCPDIGLLIMLGAPCVYCDVTDSWRLKSRWQRAAVACGGMYVELILATMAATVWLGTQAGAVNTIALQTMIVCSVSTWLINANPLMRFDGYYVVSDWFDQVNLRARADACCLGYLQHWLAGAPAPLRTDSTRGLQAGLALFSLLGWIYRTSMAYVMAAVVVSLYAAWHLPWLGRAIGAVLLFCWWGVPTMKFIGHLWSSAATPWARVRLGLISAAAVWLLCAVPLPTRQQAEGWVQPAQLQGLYAPSTARLMNIFKRPGDMVSPGEAVFQLDDSQPRMRAAQWQSSADKLQAQYAALQRQRYFEPRSEIDLRQLQSSVENSLNLVAHARAAVGRLNVQAAAAGELLSMPAPALTDIDQRPLAPAPLSWLDHAQRGRVVPAGTMLAAVCSREQIAAIPLHDHQLRHIAVGTPVRLAIDVAQHRVIDAQVQTVVRLDELDTLGRLLAVEENRFQSIQDSSPVANNSVKPTTRSNGFAAIVALPSPALVNAHVRAVFWTPPQTIAQRLREWLHHNLRWLN